MSPQKSNAAEPPRARRKRRQQYALISDGFIDSYHASNREALAAACRKYLGTQFSILRVGVARTKSAAI